MVATTGQNATSIEALDAIIDNQEFQDSPKAFMLLRVCQFAQAMRPQVLNHYWAKLLGIYRHIPKDNIEAFRILRASIEKPESESYKGFAREIIDKIGTAFNPDGTAAENAAQIVQECQDRLEKRFWPFGKKPVWIAVVKAWADIDRQAALKLLTKVSDDVRLGIITQMNNKSPLSKDEWELAQSSKINAIILEILDGDKPVLQLPGQLAEKIARELRRKIHFNVTDEAQETQYKEKREKALAQYFKLVNCIVEDMPETAQEILEELFIGTVDTNSFKDKWPEKISMLSQIITFWVSYPDLSEKTLGFVQSNDLGHYRDFAIAHWHGMTVQSKEEAADRLNEIIKECRDKKAAEIWFLVTVVRRGLGEIALQLATSSTRSEDLLPIVRRAWLLSHPETASSSFSNEDLGEDIIGQFLLLGTYEERVELLREITNNGKRSLPPEFWSKPDINRIVQQMQGNQIRDARDFSLMVLYKRDEKEENYFEHYVRMHGAVQYSYETVDPFLMSTLVVWSEKHPVEVETLLNEMWMVMEPDITLLMTDILRNNIFDRCQSVFAGSTKCFTSLFVDYVKRKLIDEGVQQHMGDNTIRTLSLKPIVPFWYCLVAAERVSKISGKCKDDLIEYALTNYECDEDMIKVAAKIYAANKGLDAVIPPIDLGKPGYEKAWQIGVVDSSAREILTALVADLEVEKEKTE